MQLDKILLSSISLLACGADIVSAQSFPSKPVRIYTSGAGGGNDLVARMIAQSIAGPLGQPVLVENRGGTIAGEIVVKSSPDGYSVFFSGSMAWLLPLMRAKSPYDALTDFVPITLVVSAPSVLAVHPSLPVKSVKDLIALARSKPGQLNYGSPTPGSSTHLAAELLNSMARIKITRIPYKSASEAVIDLIAGNIETAFVVVTQVVPHLKSGRLRALGISSATASPQLPDLPTMAASGLPGYEASAQNGMFAPLKTPEAIVNRLSQEMVRAVTRTDNREKLLALGVDPVGSTPEQFATLIKSETAKWGKVIRDAGIRDEG